MSETLSPAQVAEIRARANARCLVTGNPCGTDTHQLGRSCMCMNCLRWGALAIDIPALCDSYDAQARRIEELEESVALKEHALELALIKNVEVLQLALRDKVEATPAGYYNALTENRAEIERLKADASTLSDEVGRLKRQVEIGTSWETRAVERLFSLRDRADAVILAVHALDRNRNRTDIPMCDRVNACEILYDGLTNAIDGRATGREWATVRHRYRNERDGQHPPTVVDADRRCQKCGAVNPPYFQHCYQHAPEPIDAAMQPEQAKEQG